MRAARLSALDRFVPNPLVRGRHEVTIHAPADMVMNVARNFEIESIWFVRTLFQSRALLMGATAQPGQRLGLVTQMMGLGWRFLDEEPERCIVAGSVCRPWQADPAFTPVSADDFASFSEPDYVKIVWTLEAEELGPALTRFATETRVAATDEQSVVKFKRYWRKFGAGIVLIRLVLLPAVRRRAERMWKAGVTDSPH